MIEIVHMCPTGHSSIVPCCGKWVQDLGAYTSRITLDPALVTCKKPTARFTIEIVEEPHLIPYREIGWEYDRVEYVIGAPVFHWTLRRQQMTYPKLESGKEIREFGAPKTVGNGRALTQDIAEKHARLALAQYQQVESSRKPPVVIEIDL